MASPPVMGGGGWAAVAVLVGAGAVGGGAVGGEASLVGPAFGDAAAAPAGAGARGGGEEQETARPASPAVTRRAVLRKSWFPRVLSGEAARK
jgi:hypothetical protein